MDLKRLALFVGLPVVSIGIVIGVVLVLRSQNQIPDTGQIASPTVSSTTPQTSFGGTGGGGKSVGFDRKDLTAKERAELQDNAATVQSDPANVQDTWTPEFRKKMEATTK